MESISQAATVPYRRTHRGLEVLLITNRSGKRWILPKGLVDPGEQAVDAAVRETLEEAGVEGVPSSHPVGQYGFSKFGGACTVDVFLLKVTRVHRDWDEADFRERRWFPLRNAVKELTPPEVQDLVADLKTQIKKASMKALLKQAKQRS